ncbi:indole-3-glycerol phosphate synthase TrpC [Oceanobacillus profundus]|uniref:indole-3-glycerol phosphate synthase TrpC n=1 Tax=Oceanobacillus TaxID=182709 RepID=UPI0020410A49|nr:indole-3-glycerol phosphate synthase TrpC [Oceanobacillus profundus]MCM3398959.1 indole-3-glycerol phosphate synthase TrpC [Oceanobacillus profundus]MDO6450679.1 indole-3-glycerol phosphate synthase TrpC [Oceanobacillus profundus]
MTFLEKILTEKAKEVAKLKTKTIEQKNHSPIPTFKSRVKGAAHMNIIAEIKRSSPSKGAIHMNVDPVKQATQYKQAGAAAISVLTDEPFFNGSMDDLRAVREAVDVPILCKDFIIDPVQIDHAKAAGANIILLIVAALSKEQFTELYNYATSLDLEVLCEVHNEEELKSALEVDPEIIGINNRNLKTFEVDLGTTEKLASLLTKQNAILISESGMKTKEDVIRAADAGANVVLVGETLMRSDNVDETFKQLKIPLPVKGAN